MPQMYRVNLQFEFWTLNDPANDFEACRPRRCRGRLLSVMAFMVESRRNVLHCMLCSHMCMGYGGCMHVQHARLLAVKLLSAFASVCQTPVSLLNEIPWMSLVTTQ